MASQIASSAVASLSFSLSVPGGSPACLLLYQDVPTLHSCPAEGEQITQVKMQLEP